jgi:penicillin amidase
VTLPGAPALVAGSTGRVAWGFTNSNAGTGDIIVVSPSISPELYHGPKNGALVPYERRTETVAVRGSKPVTMDFSWTVWGPVVGDAPGGQAAGVPLDGGRPRGHQRQPPRPGGRQGRPRRRGDRPSHGDPRPELRRGRLGRPDRVDGGGACSRGGSATTGGSRCPGSSGTGAGTDFWRRATCPSSSRPQRGMLWTANNRTVGGRSLDAIGDSGYAIAARAGPDPRRPGLAGAPRRSHRAAGPPCHPAGRPRRPPRGLARPARGDAEPGRRRAQRVARGAPRRPPGNGRAARTPARSATGSCASSGSPSRTGSSTRSLRNAPSGDPDFTWTRFNYEQPLETLVKERPAHLLDPSYRTWDDLLDAAADDVSLGYERAGEDPRTATWGQRNSARIAHPFARSLPRWASSWLSMPADPLPGDSNMPRVLGPSFGASERFVVSPGHEAAGIFHMPGGRARTRIRPTSGRGTRPGSAGTPPRSFPGRRSTRSTCSRDGAPRINCIVRPAP